MKDKLPMQTSGIYGVKCNCGYCYIGKTGRLVPERIIEHIGDTKSLNIYHSIVAYHSCLKKKP